MPSTQAQDEFRLKLNHSPSPYISPLIAQWPAERRPAPLPACATCPAAMWRATPNRIECLCRTASRISWDGRQEPTLFCDGREAAIARLSQDDTAAT